MNKQTVLIIVVLVLMYLVMGASIFQILEQPYEVEQKRLIVNEKNKFISSHSCVDSQDLAGFIRHVMTAMDSGVDPIGNWSNTSKNWDLGSSFFFSGTVITTIGFGSTAPKSKWGRIFCVFYALVGIPMFGFLLAGVGELLGSALGNLISKVEYIRWKVSATVVRVISTLVSILIGCLIFMVTPVLVFEHIEEGQGREITAGHRLSSDRAVHVPSDPEEGREGSLQQTHLEPLQEVSGPPIDFTIQGLTYIDATPGSSPGDLPTPTAAISPARSPGLGPSLRLNPGQWLRRSRRNLTSRLGFSEDGNRTRDKGESV
uniref:Potassium two pore domain channel subfamily K member 4 n=1 Tax=Callorhinchus milii TaxID=7868 RepID=A0A4W3H5E4_CALMI